MWLEKMKHKSFGDNKIYFCNRSALYEKQSTGNLRQNLEDNLPKGPDGKTIDFDKIMADLNRFDKSFSKVNQRYGQNFQKRVKSVPKFDEFSQLKQLQNSAKLLPFISNLKSSKIKDAIISSLEDAGQQNTVKINDIQSRGSFKVKEDPYKIGISHASSHQQLSHIQKLQLRKKIVKEQRIQSKQGLLSIKSVNEISKTQESGQQSAQEIIIRKMGIKSSLPQAEQISYGSFPKNMQKQQQMTHSQTFDQRKMIIQNRQKSSVDLADNQDNRQIYPEIYQKQEAYDKKLEELKQHHQFIRQKTKRQTKQIMDGLKQNLQNLIDKNIEKINSSKHVTPTDSPDQINETQFSNKHQSASSTPKPGALTPNSSQNKNPKTNSSSFTLQKPHIDFKQKNLDKNLMSQLAEEQAHRDKYKAQLKRQKLELSKEEIIWEKKMKFLTETIPQIAEVSEDLPVDVAQMKKDDRGDDQWQTKLFQNCRTNNFIMHMKVLDDALVDKMRDVYELIKDIPSSDDPIYLMDFAARRKKEKAAEIAKLAAFVDNRSESQKRMHHIKTYFKENESIESIFNQKFEQTIKDMEDLTPMQKLLLEHKGRVVHYTKDGKIDVFKMIKKFQGLRRHTIYDYNPKNFNFDEVANELHSDLNKLWLCKQKSQDMEYVFCENKNIESKNEQCEQETMDNTCKQQQFDKQVISQRDESISAFDMARFFNNSMFLDIQHIIAEKLIGQHSTLNKYMRFLGQEKLKLDLNGLKKNMSYDISMDDDGQQTLENHSASLVRMQTMRLRPNLGRIQKQINLENADFLDYMDLNNEIKQSISADLLAKIDIFKKFKDSLMDSQVDKMVDHPYFRYLSECTKSVDLVLPILAKIRKGTLAISEYIIKEGHARGIRAACELDDCLITNAIFKQNHMDDAQFVHILQGLQKQLDLKKLYYSQNNIGLQSSIELSNLLSKNVPFQVQDLRLVDCHIKQGVLENLLVQMSKRNFLSCLHLVRVPLQTTKVLHSLRLLIKKSKYLRKIDLSHNTAAERNHKLIAKILKSIYQSRNFTDVNLSFINILRNPKGIFQPQDAQDYKKQQKTQMKLDSSNQDQTSISIKILKYLRKIIQKNQQLFHLNLSGIGLNAFQILYLCKQLQQKHHKIISENTESLMNVHFGQNLNENEENIPEVMARIKAILNPMQWINSSDDLSLQNQTDIPSKNQMFKQLDETIELLKTQYINHDPQIGQFLISYDNELQKYNIPQFKDNQIHKCQSIQKSHRISKLYMDVMITQSINQRKAVEMTNSQQAQDLLHPNNRRKNEKDNLEEWPQHITGNLVVSLQPNLMHIFKQNHHNVSKKRIKRGSQLVNFDMGAIKKKDLTLREKWSVSNDQKSQHCPVCGLERLTVIFWSKQYCDKVRSPEFIDEDMYYEEKGEELFNKWEAQEVQNFEKHSTCNYQQDMKKPLNSQSVMIAGSFTDWQPQVMMKLTQVLESAYAQEPEVLQIIQKGNKHNLQLQLQTSVMSIDQTYSSNKTNQFGAKQQRDLKQLLLQQNREDWPAVLKHCLKYKEPGIVNSEVIKGLQNITDIDNVYIYVGYIKPGKSDYVVRYRDSEQSTSSDQSQNSEDVSESEKYDKKITLHQVKTEETMSDRIEQQVQLIKKYNSRASIRENSSQVIHKLNNQMSIDKNMSIVKEDSVQNDSKISLFHDSFYHGRAIVDIRTEEFLNTYESQNSTNSDILNQISASGELNQNTSGQAVNTTSSFNKQMSVFAELQSPEHTKVIKACWENDRQLLTHAFKSLEKTRQRLDANSVKVKNQLMKGKLHSKSEELVKGFRVFTDTEIAIFEAKVKEFYPQIKHLYYILQSGITNQEQYPYVSRQQIIDFCFRSGISKGLCKKVKKQESGQNQSQLNDIYETEGSDCENVDDATILRLSNESSEKLKTSGDLRVLQKICELVSKDGLYLRYQLIEILIKICKYQFIHQIKPWNIDELDSISGPATTETLSNRQYQYPPLSSNRQNQANKFNLANQYDLLVTQLVIPNFHKFEKFDPAFRENQLYVKADISRVLTLNNLALQQLFRQFTVPPQAEAFGVMAQVRNQYRQSVPLNKIIKLFQNDKVNDVNVTKGQLVSCFALSKRPVERELYVPDGDPMKPKEIRVSSQIHKKDALPSPFLFRISYTEFLEMICRVAFSKFQDTIMEHTNPLSQKIIYLLDDLFQTIGIQSKDPNRQPSCSASSHDHDHGHDCQDSSSDEDEEENEMRLIGVSGIEGLELKDVVD